MVFADVYHGVSSSSSSSSALQRNWNALKQKSCFLGHPLTELWSCDWNCIAPTRALVPVIPPQWVGKGTGI